MTLVAIHQPNFLPWIGYFYKIKVADIFVLLDDVQFTKNSYINRNRIKTPSGIQWITLPVSHSGKSKQLIKETEIHNSNHSLRKIKNTFKSNYGKAKYFKEIEDLIVPMIENERGSLCELNISMIKVICGYLTIKTVLVRSSELNYYQSDSTERLISICKTLNARKYFSGLGSVKYQDSQKFADEGIEIEISGFKQPVYPQLWGDFVPNLSIVDLLFNCGASSINYIK